MSFLQTCSWCHEENGVSNTPVYCTKCGHRADVARIDCDCERCSQIGICCDRGPDGRHHDSCVFNNPPPSAEPENITEVVDRLGLPLPPRY